MNFKLTFLNLFKHKHKWKTTHTNKWMIPTRQECKCGVSRQVEIANEPLMYVWEYSDGTVTGPYSLGTNWKGI